MLISFSGLDGAGKSTLIKSAVRFLESQNQKVTLLTVYDDIAFYSFVRKTRDALKRLAGIKIVDTSANYSQSAPQVIPQLTDPKTSVQDKKNPLVRFIYRIIRNQNTRKFFLFLDLLVLRFYQAKEEILKGRVLITDRYFYDSLADVIEMDRKKLGFIRFFVTFMPEPDLPIFIDVDAEKAFERKQEYPIEYMKWRRDTYHLIFGMVKNPVIIVNDQLDQSIKTLEDHIRSKLKG